MTRRYVYIIIGHDEADFSTWIVAAYSNKGAANKRLATCEANACKGFTYEVRRERLQR